LLFLRGKVSLEGPYFPKQGSLIFGSASLGTGNTGRGDLDMMAEWEGVVKEYL
jgi:hypothetical protein